MQPLTLTKLWRGFLYLGLALTTAVEVVHSYRYLKEWWDEEEEEEGPDLWVVEDGTERNLKEE
jgi:hypothetical protein